MKSQPSFFRIFWAAVLVVLFVVPYPLWAAAWDLRMIQLDGSEVPRSITITATANSVVSFNATGTVVSKNLVQGANITITHNATDITIAASGGGGGGSGNVTGPASSVDNRMVTWNGTAGTSVKDGTNFTASANTITSSGNVTLVSASSQNIILSPGTSGNVTIPSGSLIVTGSGTLGTVTISTNSVASSGNLTLSSAASQNILLTPGASGNVNITSGNLNVTNNITANVITANTLTLGDLNTSNLTITGNLLSSTVTDGQVFIGNDTSNRLQLGTITGTADLITVTNGAGSITLNVGANVATTNSTQTLTNKTFDAAGTGNVLKQKGYIYLTHPHLADGTNATIGTTSTSIAYGHATFSNSVDEASNYVEYYFQVPEDIDTSVALRARIKILLGNTDTATHRYVLSSVSVADSAVPTASTLANAINIDFAGDGSGANGDVETSAWTTLTSWAGALTAGQTWRIRFARDGNATEDASTVNSTELGLVIEYGITQ